MSNPKPDAMAMLERYAGDSQVERLISALGVIVTTDHIREYLAKRDPMALAQCERAIDPNFTLPADTTRLLPEPILPGYELHLDNGVAGFKRTSAAGLTTFIYLNPSSEDSENVANVFLYKGTTGDPAYDGTVVYVEFDDAITDVKVSEEAPGTDTKT